MKIAVRSPACRSQAFGVTEWICIRPLRPKGGTTNCPARGHAGIFARAEGWWPALCVYMAYTSEHDLNTFEHGFFRALKKVGNMNAMNKSALVQALGIGLAGAAAATLASGTSKRARPSYSPLGFLSRRRRFQNPFARKTLTGALLSTPIISNLIGGRSVLIGGRNVKGDLLRSALLGLSAGVGSLAMPRQKGFWGTRGGRTGSRLTTVGRLLAGGLIAAAASRLFSRASRDRYAHEPHTHETHTHETHTHGRQAHEQSGA